jgi:hypothetical protein
MCYRRHRASAYREECVERSVKSQLAFATWWHEKTRQWSHDKRKRLQVLGALRNSCCASKIMVDQYPWRSDHKLMVGCRPGNGSEQAFHSIRREEEVLHSSSQT